MWNVIGHERTIAGLERAMSANRLPHALLLTGPAGIGKTTLALELAKALNCEGDGPPCQVCIHCHQIDASSHPDVTLVERSDGKEGIAIQQVRELREAASLRPYQGRRKVFIIAGAEDLTAQAADALLKTLEEPQPQVTIILTASEAEALPATIVSRCRVYGLQPPPSAEIERALRDRGEDPASAERLTRLAQGKPGWALRAARQPKLATQQEEMVNRLSGWFELDLEGRLQLAEALGGDRKDRAPVRRNLELLLLLGRDVLLLSQGLPAQMTGSGQRAVLERQAQALTRQQINDLLQQLRTAMARIDQNVDPRLTLEALLVRMP